MRFWCSANILGRKKAGLKEIAILQKLSQSDPEDKKHLIRLERSFEHKGHLCMVFENLRYDDVRREAKLILTTIKASTYEKY